MSGGDALAKIALDRRHLVAAQVRCSTGFTHGVAVEGEARPQALAPPHPREMDALRTSTPMWWLKIGRAAPKAGG